MHYPVITIDALVDNLQSQFDWVLSPGASDPSDCFSLQSTLVPVQYFNPLQPAWLNIIDETMVPKITQLMAPKNLTFSDMLSDLKGIFIFANDAHKQLPDLIALLDDLDLPYLLTRSKGQTLLASLSAFLYDHLAIEKTVHGTLLNIYNKGVLLKGDPGVGKSLTAFYCLERKHQLIADDAPSLIRLGNTVFGRCPEKLLGLLEVQPFGIINTIQQFGHSTHSGKQAIDLIIHLTKSEQPRTGKRDIKLTVKSEVIFGIEIDKIYLAFNHNIAILIEQTIRYLYNHPT